MKPGSPSRMPTRVKLALLGAVIALGALGLPWMGSRLEAIPALTGYQDSIIWVAVRVIAALATAVLALQLVKVPDLRETQRIVFASAAVVFLMRPITLIVTNPTSSELSRGGVQVDRVFSPSWGILASFVAAGLMVAAAVMTHRSDDVREAREREAARAALLQDPELAAFAGPPPAPIITSTPAAAAPVPVAEVEPAPAPVVAPAEPAPVAVPEPVAQPAPIAEPVAFAEPTPVFFPEPPAPQATPQPAPLQEIAPAVPFPQHPRAPMPDHSPYRPAASAPLENTHVAMPVIHDDHGAYGAEGPSRLGDGPNLVQVEDTLAPKAAAPAPHLALMQQPPAAPQAPAHPEPVAPPAPVAPSEPRQRSVAPPGFG